MIILAYDTETTGLPLFRDRSDHPDQPRITQIAAELVNDETREVLAGMHCIIKPEGWTIPKKLQELTGITMEKAEKFGAPIGYALSMFIGLWEMCDVRVAHNEPFDMSMVRIELVRGVRDVVDRATTAEFADKWKAGKAFCTQRESQPILNLPPTAKMVAAGFTKTKAPNLGEAYKHFTGKPLENAHNAAADLEACKAVYFGILDHRAKTAKEPAS